MEGDDEGEYTYIGARGESVIDYVIANERGLAKVETLKVATRVESDHQPIAVKITTKLDRKTKAESEKKRGNSMDRGIQKRYETRLEKIEFKKSEVND